MMFRKHLERIAAALAALLIAAGDDRVWFIDGRELFGEPGELFCRVDPYHPNDLGFYMMYTRVLPVLMDALQAAGELQ